MAEASADTALSTSKGGEAERKTTYYPFSVFCFHEKQATCQKDDTNISHTATYNCVITLQLWKNESLH